MCCEDGWSVSRTFNFSFTNYRLIILVVAVVIPKLKAKCRLLLRRAFIIVFPARFLTLALRLKRSRLLKREVYYEIRGCIHTRTRSSPQQGETMMQVQVCHRVLLQPFLDRVLRLLFLYILKPHCARADLHLQHRNLGLWVVTVRPTLAMACSILT